MPGERLSMRKIRELLRLRWEQQLPQRVIASSLGLGQGVGPRLPQAGAPCGSDMAAAGDAGRRAARGAAVSAAAGCAVRSATGPGLGGGASRAAAAEHDAGAALGRIPRRRRERGFGYSWFCDLYREWAGRLKPTLRQVHMAGERLFVDFAGHTMEVIDGATGEIQRAEVFVAVLGASSYIYAEATGPRRCRTGLAPSQHAGALGGVPRQIVSDNLKAGITKACSTNRR